MSVQIPEKLRYSGRDLQMTTYPLRDYFALGGCNPGFHPFVCSALRRGYVGSWEIVDNRLYLVSLEGTLVGGVDATLKTVFPDFPDRVFAHWFSGTICVPMGKFTHCQRTGNTITFSPELHLEFARGLLVKPEMGADSNGIANDFQGGFPLDGLAMQQCEA